MRIIIISVNMILCGISMQLENSKRAGSTLFDPELPTVKDVLMAISCVATQYALNPSYDLAKVALGLANNLNAPEYAEAKSIEEVAKKLKLQWDSVVEEYQTIEASIMPQHSLLQ
jgi:hypothetical protein